MSRTRIDKASRFMERFAMLTAMAGLIWALLWSSPMSARASDYNAVSEPGAAASKPDSYNIVLLIDKSGSMNSTDEKRHAINAARMFVDSLFAGVQNKRQIGEDVDFAVSVIPFSQDPDTDALPPAELTSKELKEWIVSTIDGIQYDRMYTGATDLGKAVMAAVQRLSNEMDASRTGRIILFTDGFTEYPRSLHENAEALEAEAAKKLNESLAVARQKGYEIYVIGLNQKDEEGKDRIRTEGVAEIQKIADTTQHGKGLIPPHSEQGKNYLITDSYAEIQKFYIGVFAYLMQTDDPRTVEPSLNQSPPEDNPQNLNAFYDIETDAKTSCLNLYVISEDSMAKDPGIWTPDGTYLYPTESDGDMSAISSQDGVLFKQMDNSERKYAILTLLQPKAGTWRLGLQNSGTEYMVQSVPISRNRSVSQFVIEFDASGGSGDMESVSVEQGASYTLPSNAFAAPDGQRFKAWSVNGEEKRPGDAIPVTADTKIVAEWESLPANACSVTFDANGGGGSMETVTLEQGASYTLPANGFTAPDSQRFKAWSVNGEEKRPGDAIPITADTKIIAEWESLPASAYNITFDANGGSGAMEEVTVEQGALYALPSNGFTAPDGQRFKAWSVNGEEKRPGDEISITANTSVRAEWEEQTEPDNFLLILLIMCLLIFLILFILFRVLAGKGKKKKKRTNTDDIPYDPDTEKIPSSDESLYGDSFSSQSQSGGAINLHK